MSCKLKEFEPLSVAVGDTFFVASVVGGRVIPTIVDKIESEGFSCKSRTGGVFQRFSEPLRGILMKEQDGKLEFFVGKETLENLEILEKEMILEGQESQ